MTVYEYPGYEADAEFSRQMIQRVERISNVLSKLRAEWDSIGIDVTAGDGDVELSVDARGRLVSLSLAEGCTVRYTHEGLEELLNTALKSAVTVAAEEHAAVPITIAEEYDDELDEV
ncbi:YbaB/EbfC family nucleoid-associated protein [Mycobacteroides abscessus subsp. abscessus]|nr:YbaB/EbfC family nucleoid-associated protein [Mycobacteroides abscessus subsp. abscessus]